MKKLKLGTRVTVNGVETFVSELHADIERGVYKVRTSNPTYEFTKNTKGCWWAYPCEGQEAILLEEAPKYGNYQVGDRVFDIEWGKGTVTLLKEIRGCAVEVTFDKNDVVRGYNLDGTYFSTREPVLKKLRVKLGENR